VLAYVGLQVNCLTPYLGDRAVFLRWLAHEELNGLNFNLGLVFLEQSSKPDQAQYQQTDGGV